jgi:hypothetical protein
MALTFNCEKLIVVEGGSDKALFKGLLANRDITGFDVICPWDMEQGLEGEDAIRQLLDALPVNRNFVKLKKILIVVDSDDDPVAKFGKFVSVLNNTRPFSGNCRYPVPNAPNELASVAGSPQVAIMLLPSSTSCGAMETLCWDAAIPNHKSIQACIEAFASCVGADKWAPQKLAKFKLRSLISTQYQSNPDLPTTKLWDKAPDIVRLDSAAFTPLSDYLASL